MYKLKAPYIFASLFTLLTILTHDQFAVANPVNQPKVAQLADTEELPESLWNQPNEDAEYDHEHVLRPDTRELLLYNALLSPLYWWWQSFLHEGSHGLMAAAYDVRLRAFKPYPHVTDSGNFRFAGYYLKEEISGSEAAMVDAAPLMLDVMWFTLNDLTLSYWVSPLEGQATVHLFAGMVCPLVDFLVNINSQGDDTDVNRLVRYTGCPKWAWMLIGNSIAGVGVWRIIHHGLRIFVRKEPVSRKKYRSTFALTPALSQKMAGLSLTGRF